MDRDGFDEVNLDRQQVFPSAYCGCWGEARAVFGHVRDERVVKRLKI